MPKNNSRLSNNVFHQEVMQGDESSAGIASDSAVGSLPTDEMPPLGEKEPDARHGNRFQSKLLMLFCIRAINAGYKFYLGTELLDQGNKFDDLIFKYTKDGEWRYQYLQAKSRLNEKENKITAEDLFAVPTKEQKKTGKINIDFSLPKYFRSYRELTRRGDEIDSCIICTNIDFKDKESLQENGIEIKAVQLNDPILQFAKISDEKNPTRYKLDINKEKFEILKEETTSKILAKMLGETKTEKINLSTKSELIRNYHIALVNENVIDRETKRFHDNFINRPDGLTEGAKELRKNFMQLSKTVEHLKTIIFSFDKNFGKTPLEPKIFNYPLPVAVKDEDIQGFLDKLIFAVNTPNEDELDDVLKSEVGNYFTLLSTDLQSAFVMNEMVNWFKRKDNVWLSSEEAKKQFLDKTKNIMESIRINDLSIDYQYQLKNDMMGLEFNSDTIQIMTEKLGRLFKDTSTSVITIGSDSPRHTAVKFIAAIKTFPDFKYDDSFLVTSSKRLNDEVEAKKFKHCLELKEDSHNLLVVVCDGEASAQNYHKYASLIPDGRSDNKINKVVIISPEKTAMITDELKYAELTDEYKIKLLSLKVSFQPKKDLGQQEMENKKITVGDLIGDKPEEVIDINSIKELTQLGRELIIPSFDDTTHFDEQMYIQRKLKFPFHDKFEDEIAKRLDCSVTQLRGECRIRPDGHIEWLVEDKRKKEIWEKIANVANQSSSSKEIHEDDRLIPLKEHEKEKSIVIISGVAGTGKSTILSHCYKQIKMSKPDHWVIRINLVDHYGAILKLDNNSTCSNAVGIFINELHVVENKSSFSRSLLRNRLETGERIVVMFDGFDEINDLCQDKAIELMKAITKEKSIQLYVTTRPHMLDKLQFQLSQLSYSLANFQRNDQIDFLTKYWEKELDLIGDKNGPIQQFAESFVHRVSETLKDKESSFIGIPLQCRIVAECFQPNFSALGENYDRYRVNKLIADLLDGQSFDLANLYRRLMETKRRVFLEEKAQIPSFSVQNDFVVDAINQLMQDVEDHLTKLAIETLVTDRNILETLLPPQSSYRSDEDLVDKENKIALNGLKFGLTFKGGDESKVQFLHRTYAEYLFARYLYQGFLLDEKRHNKILENESIRMLILKKILARPEYHGVQVFFNSMLKELVDGDEEWRNRIDRRDLPERIKTFTENFYDQFLYQELPPQETVARDSGGYSFTTIPYQRFDSENALHYSLSTGKTTIFTLLCDCLDATFDKETIQNVMMKSFMQKGIYFSFEFFRKTKSKLFKRFIDYLDSEAGEVMSTLTANPACLPPCDLEYSQWNGEEQKKTVHHLLQFMTNQYEAFDNCFRPNDNEYFGITAIVPMLNFFIFNENYESHLKIFLGLLSRSTAYSNDSKFENLLKKAFCSKEHFIGGRIEKVLITLRELNRKDLLIQLCGIVLAIKPEAFQNIYQPLPIEIDSMGKDVTAGTDMKKLMERDSYRMTRLHRAAFHRNKEAVEEMLGRIRQNLADPEQKKVADQIINEVLARDEYGFTPFYVAAASGQEEIYHKMLDFLKQILPDKKLEKYWTDTNGFVRRGLSDAIDSENIQMFQLILKTVKKVLGQQELIRILRLQKCYDSKFFFLECKTKELFNAMTEIVVTREDSTVMDYTDFYDLLIFHDAQSTQTFAECIDAENLKELISLNGVDKFTKRFLDTISSNDSGVRYHRLNNDGTPLQTLITRQTIDSRNLYSIGFPLLSNHVLKHFTKVQLEQFVETITSKNNWKQIGGTSHGVYKSIDLANAESITLDLLHLGWNREDLEFQDNGDDTTTIFIKERLVPRNSYWRDFIISAARFNFMSSDGFGFLDGILQIFDCFKRVNDSFLKKLLLHEDDNGFIMIHLSLEAVQRMMTYLSKESQEDVKQQWKENAPSMDMFFSSTKELSFSKVDDKVEVARYWTNVFRFYLHYGSEVHLKEFVNIFTSLRDIGAERRSVCSYIFEYDHKGESTKEILKLVSEKAHILGSDALKTILLHKLDDVPLPFKAVLWGLDIDAWLEILPKEIREEIQQFMTINAPELIDRAYQNPQILFKIFDSQQHYYNRLNTLISFLNYSNDIQLQQFVQNITSFDLTFPIQNTRYFSAPIQQEKKCSIWAELFTHKYHDCNTDDIAQMDKFMKCVSEKLGSNAVKELVLHNDGERPVIFYPALRGEQKLLEKIHKYLTVNDRKDVQCQVDKFLDEKYKISLRQHKDISNVDYYVNETYTSDAFYSTTKFGLTKRENPGDKKPDYDERMCLPEIASELTKPMFKHEKAMEKTNQRLDVLEMKAPVNDPPTTRPENIQEMIITEENNKPGEDETIIKSVCENTAKDSKLTEQIPESRPMEVTLDRENYICSRSFFAIFRGSYNGKPVAIKQVPTDKIQFQEKEEKILGQFNHPNVIKLLQVTQDVDFRIYVFELTAGTVDDFCDRIYRGKMPSDDEALKQMAGGLLYIHGKQFAHLNIKPSSVFISTSEPVRLMIAKFGSCEATKDTGTFSIGYDNKGGAAGWMAPEILEYFDYFHADSDDDGEEPVNNFSIACDTWSLGCLFFYFLTRGIHPYGEDDGEDDNTIRWNIVVEQNPVELEAMQASNHEDNQIYELIRDMIETEPEKRISLETVAMRLETLFPPSATGQEYRKHDQPTQDGNCCQSSQKSGSTSKDIEKGNVYQTTVSGGLSSEKIDEVEGKTPDAQEKDDDKSEKTKLKEEGKCCNPCNEKFNEIKETMEELKKFKVIKDTMKELQKSVGNAHEKIGHLNESAIRSNLRSNERGEARNISSLYQLVKCYGEAQDQDWTERDTYQNCKRVVEHLKAETSEESFCLWYHSQASKQQKGLAQGLAKQIEDTPMFIWSLEISKSTGLVIKNYSVAKLYESAGKQKLQNYLQGPISNWDDYYEPSGPIFLLALYQSIKDKPDLLSFPPPGILTMDYPVKISRANSSVHIEVGEIKSSDEEKVIKNAKLQLRRSLLCFKWLDTILSKKKMDSYGLIGNIFINGNCTATQKKNVTGKVKEDNLKEEGILIKQKYKIYK